LLNIIIILFDKHGKMVYINFKHQTKGDTMEKSFKENFRFMATHYPEHFHAWFDKDDFPTEDYIYLAVYCADNFTIWFDKKTFPKDDYKYLATYCSEHVDIWFDKKTFPKDGYKYLAKYCSDNFDIWYDVDVFPEDDYKYLIEHCPKYNNIDKYAPKKEYGLVKKIFFKYIWKK